MNQNNHPSTMIWFDKPADAWEQGLPLGNGKLGAMSLGGVQEECIYLNEETLWSGFSRDPNNYDAIRHLAKVRNLISQQQYKEAEEIIERHMLGPWHECYLPLGKLHIIHAVQNYDSYVRKLDLIDGIAVTSYTDGVKLFEREMFVSAIDQVFALRLTQHNDEQLHIRLKLTSDLRAKLSTENHYQLSMYGRCPSHVEPDYIEDHPYPIQYEDGLGLAYYSLLSIVPDEGTVIFHEDHTIEITAQSSICIYFTAATEFSRKDTVDKPDYTTLCRERIMLAEAYSFEQLKQRHLNDFRSISERAIIELQETAISFLPTDVRIQRAATGESDPALAALFVQLGKYLLQSSSRQDTQPATLQGIWSKEIRSPWGSNYTTNINLPMNYWLAETANMSECHFALLDWIGDLAQKGKRTAHIHYGCRGWTAHHNVDLWLDTSPAGGQAVWAMWPLAGAWLSAHLWEHYLYTLDTTYLRNTAYPLMKEAALFFEDFLIYDESIGYYVTSPSTSPEHKFKHNGEISAVSKASTLDITLIRELFTNCIEASRLLNCDHDWRLKINDIVKQLPPFKIGSRGQLQEWYEDFEDNEPGHRHFSHLYGLFPGSQIEWERDPFYADAAMQSLKRRMEHGGGHTGWSCAWSMAIWARLKQSDQVLQCWHHLLRYSVYGNLLGGHPHMIGTMIDHNQSIFQIDANFGGARAIVETLIQSFNGILHLLPAIPQEWNNGRLRGFKAQQGITIDMEWEQQAITKLTIHATHDCQCILRVPNQLKILNSTSSKLKTINKITFYEYELQLTAGSVTTWDMEHI